MSMYKSKLMCKYVSSKHGAGIATVLCTYIHYTYKYICIPQKHRRHGNSLARDVYQIVPYVYVCKYTNTHMPIFIQIHKQIYMYTYMHVNIYVYIYIYIHIYTCIYTYIYVCANIYTFVYIYIDMYVH